MSDSLSGLFVDPLTGLVAGVAAALFYLLAALQRALWLARGATPRHRPRRVALAAAALLCHAVALWALVVSQWITLGFFHALSFAAWLTALLLLLVGWSRPVGSLGVLLFPVAAAAIALQLLFPGGAHQPPSAMLDTHILLAMLAYGLLTIAALLAGLWTVQDRCLRRKRPGGFMRALPALEETERLMFRVIRAGVAALTLALFSGLLFSDALLRPDLLHKSALSLLAWLLFAVLLWGRARNGWRGRVAMRWTLIGFGSLALAYFGDKLLRESLFALL